MQALLVRHMIRLGSSADCGFEVACMHAGRGRPVAWLSLHESYSCCLAAMHCMSCTQHQVTMMQDEEQAGSRQASSSSATELAGRPGGTAHVQHDGGTQAAGESPAQRPLLRVPALCCPLSKVPPSVHAVHVMLYKAESTHVVGFVHAGYKDIAGIAFDALCVHMHCRTWCRASALCCNTATAARSQLCDAAMWGHCGSICDMLKSSSFVSFMSVCGRRQVTCHKPRW